MDETSLVRHVSGLLGTVVKTSRTRCQLGEVAPLHDRRSYITYLATITHDSEVQPRLPQVLIGNERQFTKTIMNGVEFLPNNVYMWRCKSAWNSHLLMRRYLSLLASCLGSTLKERYVILILDVARCHLHPTILGHAKRCGIRLCFIPALMTAELQPCDTHLFARFKSTFQEQWRRQKSLSVAGSVSTHQWLEIVASTIQAVLPTDWEAAFAGSGALAEQTHISDALCMKLGWTCAPVAPEGLPSVQTASLVFPRKMKVHVQAYVSWGCHAAAQMKAFEARRRRPLPSTFTGSVHHPLTID